MVFRLLFSLLMCSISAYLTYYGIYGERGYYAWQDKKILVAELQAKKARIKAEQEVLKAKVMLMQDQIEKDYLEQCAWAIFKVVPSDAKIFSYQ